MCHFTVLSNLDWKQKFPNSVPGGRGVVVESDYRTLAADQTCCKNRGWLLSYQREVKDREEPTRWDCEWWVNPFTTWSVCESRFYIIDCDLPPLAATVTGCNHHWYVKIPCLTDGKHDWFSQPVSNLSLVTTFYHVRLLELSLFLSSFL